MQKTTLTYMTKGSLLTTTATVNEVIINQESATIILDNTIFYPQGGGQPFDTGVIQNSTATFNVEEVRFVDGIVHHIGKFETGQFENDSAVELSVNPTRRLRNNRLHTAGHLIDIAITELGYSWPPLKGYHFPDGAYVEYQAIIEENEKNALSSQLEKTISAIIDKNLKVSCPIVNPEELHKFCRSVPPHLPANKPVRMMVVEGYDGIPCGGTHVSSLGEVGAVLIVKIKTRPTKKIVRIRYDIST